jgi:glycyl-tRNA synthetase
MNNKEISVSDMAAFCKKKGFVYPSGEIYGGLSGFFDFGPVGLMLKRNIRELYWDEFVRKRQGVAGLDGSLITAPRVWKASGHLDNFFDHLIVCSKCKTKMKAEEFIEDTLNIDADGLSEKELKSIIKEKGLRCPKCKGSIKVEKPLNLMFSTEVGAGKESITSYLRPETAQSIFANFKNIFDSQRLKLPFGIAQMGKAFRNEISPRNFLFRAREFEQVELEFFVHPDKVNEVDGFEDIKREKVNFLSREEQNKDKPKMKKASFNEIAGRGNKWQAYWLYLGYKWFAEHGISRENLRIREHLEKELAHYATACFDIDYRFPFGWKEVVGNADRGQYDLKQHMKESNVKLEIFDEVSKSKVIPYVASEPSFGVERAFLVFLFEAFEFDEERENNVLHFHPKIAPYKVGVFPLIKKPELIKVAKDIFERLNKSFPSYYDESGTIGRRYSRQDEIGTPFCITVDFDSLKDNSVTIRDRDTKKQIRLKIKELEEACQELIEGRREI